MGVTRWLAGALVVALAGSGLTGCALVDTQSCVDWVVFDTPAAAARDAAAVVVGRVGVRAGTTNVFGAESHVWTVQVSRWITGSGGDSIRVTSVPETCAGAGAAPYPAGDPFEKAMGNRESVLFLSREGGSWRGITPSQAIVEASDAGGIPDAWPPGSPGSPGLSSPSPIESQHLD